MKAHNNNNSPRRKLACCRPLSCLLSLALILQPAYAQVALDRGAPKSQQPTLSTAGNGVPLVNIQTPSAAGVSRNTYSQFDVGTRGLILNNARSSAQTQLGGWIAPNPWLASGSARVILNEVHSSNPSALHGFVEVGGARAQVVIANPAGITCDGCGFLNSSRATLTTGLPSMVAGSLTGYTVERGRVLIEGAGLDSSRSDATDIFAQSVSLNAGVWANDLSVIAGVNRVSVDGVRIEPIAANAAAAPVLIDVARLGGMYANRIHLVATDAGVGVNSVGATGARPGEAVVGPDGRLGSIVNRGTLDAKQISVSAPQLDNLGSGRLFGDAVAIDASVLNNVAENATAPVIATRKQLDVSAQSVRNRDHALLLSAGDLSLHADTLTNASATIQALGSITIAARRIDNADLHFASTVAEQSRTGVVEYQPAGSPNRYRPDQVSTFLDEVQILVTPNEPPTDNWNRYDYTRVVSQTLATTADPGQISAGGDLRISADTLRNDKSRILAGGALVAKVGTLTNFDALGERTTRDVGTVTDFFRIHRPGTDDQGASVTAYRPAPAVQTITVRAAQFKGRSAGAGTRLPDSALFALAPAPGAHYLMETDPRFASYRTWLSSDYQLKQLQLDPASTTKRLGDGFYEQTLVREQVASLTGRRYLAGFDSDEAQYRALLDNGASMARRWSLRPGIALSAAQIAQLTTDVVWLVDTPIKHADGRIEHVLVPQLYAKPQSGDLDGSGALLSGASAHIDISSSGLIQGNVAGRTLLALNANGVELLGRMSAAQTTLNARTDLNIVGGSVQGEERLSVSAGRDLNVVSTTHASTSESGARVNLDRIAGLYLTGKSGNLSVRAGRDMNLTGAQISANSAQIAAGSDLTLATVRESSRNQLTWDAANKRSDTSGNEVGTKIAVTEAARLQAGHDLSTRAANITSEQGAVNVSAGSNVTLDGGQSQKSLDEAHRVQGSNGLLSSKTTTTRDTLAEARTQGTLISANSATVQAGGVLAITGSSVVSTQGTTLRAGDNVSIRSGIDKRSETHFRQEQTTGVFSGGNIGFTAGSQDLTSASGSAQTSAAAATVGSTAGNVSIRAGQTYQQVGSTLSANAGDVNVAARNVAILDAQNVTSATQETRFKQSGLSVSLTSPVIAAIQAGKQMHEAAEQVDDARLKALAGANAALSAKSAYDAVAKDGVAGSIKISISIGASKSESQTSQNASTVAGSIVSSGRDVTITAAGAGKDSNLTVRGSQVQAGNDATLRAGGNIDLQAGQNQFDLNHTDKSSSASVGVGFSLGGASNGLTVDVGVSGSRGKAQGNDVVWTNAHVAAGNVLKLESGDDTTLKGAVASGKQVQTRVGGNLDVESLQDTSVYTSKQESAGVSLSICVPPLCYGASSASASFGKSNVESNYASVNEQSGIRAGDAGFQIDVKRNTNLAGAVIASTAQESADHKNALATGTLTASNIANAASGSADSAGLELSSAMLGQGKYGAAKALMQPLLLGSSHDGKSSGASRAAIDDGVVTIRDLPGQQKLTGRTAERAVAGLDRDTKDANVVATRIDAQALARRAQAEHLIKQETFRHVVVYTDDAYKTLFQTDVKFYRVKCRGSAVECLNDPSKIATEEISRDQAKKEGKVLAVNGIMNDRERAAQLAYQNVPVDKEKNKPNEIVLVHISPADTNIGELLAGGYEVKLAKSLGYSNADREYADVLEARGKEATLSLGHSRGTAVQENAFDILAEKRYVNKELSVVGVGSPKSMEDYTASAARVTTEDYRKNITFQYMTNDPIAVAAGNSGDAIAALREMFRVIATNNSEHSCYGTGATGCATIAAPLPGGPKPVDQQPSRIRTYKGGTLDQSKDSR
jgi:filamentous hemagglutinin